MSFAGYEMWKPSDDDLLPRRPRRSHWRALLDRVFGVWNALK